MPYVGKELSMLIFLPNQIEDSSTGLEKVGHADILLKINVKING